MQCRDVRELADSFLDQQLLTETTHEILRHLDSCSACRGHLSARRDWSRAIRSAFDRSPALAPRPEFVRELRSTLRSRGGSPRWISRSAVRWWAIAALLLLAAGGGALYRRRVGQVGTMMRAAAGDHRNCAVRFRLTEKPIPLDEAARRYGGPYGVLQRIPAAEIATVAGPARVVERHACVFAGHRFAHVVIEFHGTRVSLLVADSPAGAGLPRSASVDGVNLVAFAAPNATVFVVGDIPAALVAALADAVAGPLERSFSGA